MTTLLIIFLTIIFSAVFSGLEIAYVSSDKMLIEMNSKKEESKINSILSRFISNPSRFIATLLIGNNLALVIYGIYMERALTPAFNEVIPSGALVFILQTLISTIIILILAEFLPKTLFRIQSNKVLGFFAFPMFGFYWLMKWVVSFFVWLSKIILRYIFKIEVEEDRPIFGRLELEQYLENRTQDIDEEEVDNEVMMYKNALDFSTIKVKECMVPRTEIEALEVNTPIATLKEIFLSTGYSKVMIYKSTIDEIIGFVHIYEMFKEPKNIMEVLLPVGYIPQTMSAQETLNNFIKKRKSVFVVVDEFGGTAGMITIEDLVEEILGEIEDEHDTQEYIEKKLNDNEFLFSGRLEIDYLNEKYNLELQVDEQYETLAGLLFTYLERIPEEGENIDLRGVSFTIEEVSDTRIELVKLKIEE